jgi:hypothetical protein
MKPLAIMLLVSLVVALYLRANREKYFVAATAIMAVRGTNMDRNIKIGRGGSYGTHCKKHSRWTKYTPGSQGPCKLGYYYQGSAKLGCMGKSSRGMCVRINVPQQKDRKIKLGKKDRKKLEAAEGEERQSLGNAMCDNKFKTRDAYTMENPDGRKSTMCMGIDVPEDQSGSADMRVEHQTKCRRSKRYKNTMGKQGKCEDTFITSKIFKSNCAGKARRAMCTPSDYDMSVYPVKIPGADSDDEEDDSDDSGDEGGELKNLREELATCERRRKKDRDPTMARKRVSTSRRRGWSLW